MFEHLSDLLTYGGLFVFVIGMAWNDGVDRATNYIVTATNWNDLIGASGSLMQLKSHAHGGTTGEGSQSLGPLVKATFTDAAAPAAPAAGQTSIYTVSAKPRYRANGGADRAIITDETTAAGDLAGTYPNPTVAKVTLGSDADGDIYYRASSALARLPKGTANQLLAMNGAATAPIWITSGTVAVLDKKTSTTTISNSAVETTLYTKTVSANTIGATGALRLVLFGTTVANGNNLTFTWRLKFGATTIGAVQFPSYGVSAVAHHWQIEFIIENTTTSAQRCWGMVNDNGAAGAFANVTTSQSSIGYGTAAEDTTASKDIVITGQFSDGTATVTCNAHFGILELLP